MDYAGALSDLASVMEIRTLSLLVEVTVAGTSVAGCSFFSVLPSVSDFTLDFLDYDEHGAALENRPSVGSRMVMNAPCL